MKIAWLVESKEYHAPIELHKYFPEYMAGNPCYEVTQIVYQEVIEDDD